MPGQTSLTLHWAMCIVYVVACKASSCWLYIFFLYTLLIFLLAHARGLPGDLQLWFALYSANISHLVGFSIISPMTHVFFTYDS